MVPKLYDEIVQKLLKKINSKYEPIYLPIKAESYSSVNDCFLNVEKKIAKDGGDIVYGWQIWKTNLICEAEFHALWRSNEGNLVDITPKGHSIEDKQILFIQDDKITYNGAQVDNIRINCTNNVLVNDFIETRKALFRIMNRGERVFSYEFHLEPQEEQVYNELEYLSTCLLRYIHSWRQINSPCFCGSVYNYSECHRKRLDSLIMLSKAF